MMKFTKLKIPDIIVCEPEFDFDERGYFVENFRKDELDKFLGYSVSFCQENETSSTYGVIRGLHYQQAPHGQTKLVRVIKGKVIDVVVDVRENSKTFGEHVSIELSDENKKQLFIPVGFAHGFVVLSDKAILNYKVDNYYNFASERGIAYNDKFLNIDWQLSNNKIKLSAKDKNHPLFKDSEYYITSKHKKC